MKRSLLVQTLLDMATGSGGAKLEALVVDAAGTFDAGSGKGYNPVTVPSGSVNVLGEKGVVSNNSVVVTPKAQIVGGWLNSGETSGSGVGVTASELVSGTLNVSSAGETDVTNYQKVSVDSGSATPSASKGTVSNHIIQVTPIVTKTAGIITSGSEQGTPVSVGASELVSGTLNISSDGVQDVTNYQNISVPSAGHSASAHKGSVSNHSITVTPRSTATQGFVQAGTVDGTPISIAVSELVSGTLSVTTNGSFDVTNYKDVNVNIAPNTGLITFYGNGSPSIVLNSSAINRDKVIIVIAANIGTTQAGLLYGFPSVVYQNQRQAFTFFYREASALTYISPAFGYFTTSGSNLTIETDGRLLTEVQYNVTVIN